MLLLLLTFRTFGRVLLSSGVVSVSGVGGVGGGGGGGGVARRRKASEERITAALKRVKMTYMTATVA